ncbi:hypothetical protein C5167_018701 [Papaver somniferum]|uniref:L-gulonolactone oxidase n=1 Tax=Papaver somniferum TaxID=3469 RepID=A0A4Y7IN11_PAPSO|nr:L-gulonolactone oxidase 3-like isoform X1 [Papaver somniferum]RZC50274.1 hypothetical protein C5167_018701 [Papaver somniferum]
MMNLTMASFVWLVSCLWLLMFCSTSIPKAYAMPPQSPVKCDATGCILRSAYGVWNDRKECWVQKTIYPTTEEELRLAVADANQKKFKVKIVTGSSHSIPKLACPGTKSTKNSVLISTAKYNSGIKVDVESLTVTADSGVGLRDLINKVEDAGLSLVTSPYWEGLSIGGVISTGAHGSSWWGKGGAVHDHVVGLSLVVPAKESEGYAKVIQLDSRNQIFNAAKVSIGMLGAISKVQLSLEPGFKRSITNIYNDDSHFEDEFIGLAQKHEFADITWYPSKHTTIYRQDDRVPLNSSGNGINDYFGFQSFSVLTSSAARSSEEVLEGTRNVNGKCRMADTVVGFMKLIANGLRNNNLGFTGYPVVGCQGKMQTSGSCLYTSKLDNLSTCVWDPRIKGAFCFETAAIISASKFRNFIQDVKKLRDLKPEHLCGADIYYGFLMRFVKASDAYLGQPEDSVVVQFTYYRANEASTPRLNQDVWEEVEQIAFFKYGARPHWAKNRNLVFLGVQQKYPNFGKFLKAKKQLDPENMFSGDWSDEILSGNEAAKAEGCAMEGLCICSEDKHCNPSKGYLCKPGIIYNKARVCRFSTS